MKRFTLAAAAVVLAGSLSACSDNASSPQQQGKRMGDDGQLPSTSTMGEHVPTMGSGATPSDDPIGHVTPKGPQERMGDEGKLPATRAGSDRVPDMTGPSEQSGPSGQ
jgi:hypothetical protein